MIGVLKFYNSPLPGEAILSRKGKPKFKLAQTSCLPKEGEKWRVDIVDGVVSPIENIAPGKYLGNFYFFQGDLEVMGDAFLSPIVQNCFRGKDRVIYGKINPIYSPGIHIFRRKPTLRKSALNGHIIFMMDGKDNISIKEVHEGKALKEPRRLEMQRLAKGLSDLALQRVLEIRHLLHREGWE